MFLKYLVDIGTNLQVYLGLIGRIHALKIIIIKKFNHRLAQSISFADQLFYFVPTRIALIVAVIPGKVRYLILLNFKNKMYQILNSHF